ncbi:hypothetical protein SAMN02745866_02044 [Alteromonadaceae bacterium Bs31]|nr:hypothetical protein SAMN02745866_02044 [Alteromonadaceae bacterium Bs31]
MSDISLVVLFLAIAMAALMLVSAVNQKQLRSRVISQKLAQMKRRVADMEELAVNVDSLVDSAEIAKHVNDEVLDMIEIMRTLDGSSQSLLVMKDSAQRLADEYHNPQRPREIYRLQDSDAAIARSLYQLNDAGRIIRKRQAEGKLEIAQMENCIHELAWAHMLVAVTSSIAQGHKAMNRGDVLRAFAFYKKAQQVAMQTSSTDERRQELIKQITDMLNNKRKSLSTDFMPETQFNPSKDSEPLPPDTMFG